MSNTVLYFLWGGLYALCAGLGFVTEPGATLRLLMILLSVALFIPPFVLNRRGNRRVRMLVRNLSGIWLILTGILLVLNILSALGSETLGNFLYRVLLVVSSPMVCSGSWGLSLFLWACLLMVSLGHEKKK